MITFHDEMAELIDWMDTDLDSNVAELYKGQPLAQDWARIAKVIEETGEVIDAYIGVTGQNPRKGEYGDMGHVLSELCDVALTGLYAIQHFTKDAESTLGQLHARALHHRQRREAQIDALDDGELPEEETPLIHIHMNAQGFWEGEQPHQPRQDQREEIMTKVAEDWDPPDFGGEG